MAKQRIVQESFCCYLVEQELTLDVKEVAWEALSRQRVLSWPERAVGFRYLTNAISFKKRELALRRACGSLCEKMV